MPGSGWRLNQDVSHAGTGSYHCRIRDYRRIPVSREVLADRFTPVEVMRTLRAASRHCYLLESAASADGQTAEGASEQQNPGQDVSSNPDKASEDVPEAQEDQP